MKKIIHLAMLSLLSIALYSCGGSSKKESASKFLVKEQVGDKYFVLVHSIGSDYDAYLCNDTNSYEDGLKVSNGSPCVLYESSGILSAGNVYFFVSIAESIIFDDDFDNENKRFVITQDPPFNDVIFDIQFGGNEVQIYTDEGKYITYSMEDHEQMKEVFEKTFHNGDKSIKDIEKNSRFSKKKTSIVEQYHRK